MESAILMFMVCFVFICAIAVMGFLIYCIRWLIKSDRKNNNCKWSAIDDYNSGFDSACGKEFYCSDESGDCVTEWASYCPFCGKKIKVK